MGGRISVIAYLPGREKGLQDGNFHLVEDHTDHLHDVVFLADGEGLLVNESVSWVKAKRSSRVENRTKRVWTHRPLHYHCTTAAHLKKHAGQ